MSRTLPRIAASIGAIVLAAGTGAAAYALVDSDSPETVRTVATGVSTASSSGLSVSQIYQRAHEGVVEITVDVAGFRRRPGAGLGLRLRQVRPRGHEPPRRRRRVDGPRDLLRTGTPTTRPSSAPTPPPISRCSKVDAPASVLTPLALGDSSQLAVGDGVVAIGSPFGLEQTVTAGIVSALERQMEAPNGFTINDSIQTDAAINHGNSGGPLLDLEGRVVGVNAQISSESGGNDGVGFAIPSNTVDTIVSQILADGDVEHAYLGVGVATIPESATGELDSAAGVALTEVRQDTPAAEAGLRAGTGTTTIDGRQYPTGGDVVTEVDGEAVETAEDLQRAIDAHKPGDTITLTVVRDGDTRTVDVTLDSRPS